MSEVVERLAQARVLPVLSAPDADGAIWLRHTNVRSAQVETGEDAR